MKQEQPTTLPILSESESTKTTPEENIMHELITRLEAQYVFRRNTVMGYNEFRTAGTPDAAWAPLTDAAINTLTTELLLAGVKVWDRDVRRYLHSTRIPVYNPVDEYLRRVRGHWDGRDHIRALADRVPTVFPRRWRGWFHHWFLAMVAQWQGRDLRYGNAIVPLLISEQGMHKSTFCRQLLPEELRRWGYMDNLVLTDERRIHLVMSQMLLINLDEFNRISPQKQQGMLKNLVQLPSVKVRRPYASHTEDVPRLASFIATTNERHVLADLTGSRRFIGVEVTGSIDTRRPNHEQLYAQALAELDKGCPWWFTAEETRSIMSYNRRFAIMADAEAYFHECFIVPDDEKSGEWMTPAAIISHIRKRIGPSFKIPAVSHMGRILTNIRGLRYQHTRDGRFYFVRPA